MYEMSSGPALHSVYANLSHFEPAQVICVACEGLNNHWRIQGKMKKLSLAQGNLSWFSNLKSKNKVLLDPLQPLFLDFNSLPLSHRNISKELF